MIQKTKYRKIAVAGTFDRLHKGHEGFINHAFKIADNVVIGVTSDEFSIQKTINNKQKIDIQITNFQTRKRELVTFLEKNRFSQRYQIIQIDDVYGTADKDLDLQAILVTEDSENGGEQVNKRRTELRLPPLVLEKFNLIMAEDNKKISSTRIRIGEIDRIGRVFARHDVFGDKVGEKLRLALKSPLGEVIVGDSVKPLDNCDKVKKYLAKYNPVMVISVGDITTKLCNIARIDTAVNIVDFIVNRIAVHTKMSDIGFTERYNKIDHEDIIRTTNPAGHMTKEMVDCVRQAISKYIQTARKIIVKVDGEEDLVGVPAILFAPLGSIVLYGQPGEGTVIVEVTEEKKSEILKIIEMNY